MRAGSMIRWALLVLAVAVGAGTFLKAVLDVSTTWDVWYYHLPFAARIWGIVPADAYAFNAVNQHRFDGFPLLGELLQGLFWFVFRRPEAANLVAFGSLAFYVLYLKRAFAVPLRLSTLALMAIPLVQMHASACYIDLPANVFASVLVMATYRIHVEKNPPSQRAVVGMCLAAAAAGNMRFQLLPLVLLMLVLIGIRIRKPLLADLRGAHRRRAARTLAILCIALPIIFASPLKNVVRHHNPFFPMKLAVAGLTLPYAEDAYSDSPPYLQGAPQPQRWAYSLLEVGIRPMTDRARWTIDQWMPPGSDGNRMGGAFGAYVVANLLVLGWLASRDRTPEVRMAAALFFLLSGMTAVMPQSHELRYYLYWMMVTVSLNLVLLVRRPPREASGFGVLCAAALVVVLVVTRASYVVPSGYSFAALLRDKVNPAVLGEIHDGDRVCFYPQPWTHLYVSRFHPPLRFAVREGGSVAECGDYRFIE